MIIIGEKLNGTISTIAEAIKNRDEKKIQDLAKRQTEAGADFIDVCSSVSKGDAEVLKWMITQVQKVSDARISIDSPDPHAIVEAMDTCSKPGLINSVSLEGDKMDTVFPVISGTDWEVISLLCDNNKIPDTIEEREKIFDQTLEKINEYKIDPKKVYIDPLVFSIGTKPDSFTNFAEVVRYVRSKCPEIHITCGVSNISFGIPARRIMNHVFLPLAMQAGVDCAIIDPTDRDMLGTLYAAEVLLEKDEYCMNYIEAYQDGKFGVPQTN